MQFFKGAEVCLLHSAAASESKKKKKKKEGRNVGDGTLLAYSAFAEVLSSLELSDTHVYEP